MKVLRELRSDAPPQDTDRLAAGRERLLEQIAATRVRPRWSRVRAAGGTPTWMPERARRNGVVGLTAVAVAGVLATAAVLMQGAAKPHPSDVASPPGTPAATLLTTAAATVAAGPAAKEPGPNQWLYTRTARCQQTWCTTVDSWVRYRDGIRADIENPAEDGTPPKKIEEEPASTELGMHPRIDRAWLASLPSEPHALLKAISAKDLEWPFPAPTSHQSPEYQFRRILDVLEATQPTPPKYEAELYRALAVIPGVEIHPGLVKDAAKRDGLAIGIHGGNGEYLVLDPVTYAYRGLNWDLRGSSPLLRTYALKAAGVVDHVGQVPGGPVPPPSSVEMHQPARDRGPDGKTLRRTAPPSPGTSSSPGRHDSSR